MVILASEPDPMLNVLIRICSQVVEVEKTEDGLEIFYLTLLYVKGFQGSDLIVFAIFLFAKSKFLRKNTYIQSSTLHF